MTAALTEAQRIAVLTLANQVTVRYNLPTGGYTSSGGITLTGANFTLDTPVSVAHGGTGLASGTSGGIPAYTGSTTIASSGVLAANALVIGGGAAATPATNANWTVSSNILHGSADGSTLPADAASTVLHVGQSNASVILNDSATSGGNFIVRRCNTSFASPSALASADVIGGFSGIGYGATGYGTSRGYVRFLATENWSDSAQGTRIAFGVSNTGTATTPVIVGAINFNGCSFKGTTTNDSATAGNMGEYVEASAATNAVSLTTATPANATSVSLTAGDWDVEGLVQTVAAAGTVITGLIASLSSTTATLGTQGLLGRFDDVTTYPASASPAAGTGRMRISIASTTTIYLVAQAAFSVSTLTCGGEIQARRIR